MIKQLFALFCVLASFCFSLTAQADGDSGCASAQNSLVRTEHSITLDGHVINYTASAGYIEVVSPDKSAKACMFYTAYTVAQPTTAKPRPITFAFNGGPGSASLWLHLGLLGPKRVNMGEDGLRPAINDILVQNESSFLDLTDIVMIDPISTGFSHGQDGASNNPFFGVLNDYISVATFIRNYLNTNNRWLSPKFILGESYGGVRGSLLANHLQRDFDIGVSGLILISPALSDQSLDFGRVDNNVPYWTNFPSMATTAWYHHTIAAKYQSMTVDEIFSVAQKFANTVLRDALDAGNALDQAQFEQVARQMSEFIGVSAEEIQQNNLKISSYYFFLSALASQNQVVGRYDSRFTAVNIPGPRGGYLDPSDAATSPIFAAGINQYLRVDLNWQSASPYNVFGEITQWPDENDASDVVSDLGHAFSENPNFKLFVANGYFDFACSLGADDYELSQIPGGRAFANRITHNRYFGGHMMYINPVALHQLKADLTLFMTAASQPSMKSSLH